MTDLKVGQSTIDQIIKWGFIHFYLFAFIIIVITTAFIAKSRNVGFFQVWFNGTTPRWMIGKKHKEKFDTEHPRKRKDDVKKD